MSVGAPYEVGSAAKRLNVLRAEAFRRLNEIADLGGGCIPRIAMMGDSGGRDGVCN